MTDMPRLTLPADLSIVVVGNLMPDWVDWLDRLAAHTDGQPRVAGLDAGAVEQVDSAGLQLLVSLGHALEARGWSLRLHGVGAPLVAGCDNLGLGRWLALRTAQAAEAAA